MIDFPHSLESFEPFLDSEPCNVWLGSAASTGIGSASSGASVPLISPVGRKRPDK